METVRLWWRFVYTVTGSRYWSSIGPHTKNLLQSIKSLYIYKNLKKKIYLKVRIYRNVLFMSGLTLVQGPTFLKILIQRIELGHLCMTKVVSVHSKLVEGNVGRWCVTSNQSVFMKVDQRLQVSLLPWYWKTIFSDIPRSNLHYLASSWVKIFKDREDPGVVVRR